MGGGNEESREKVNISPFQRYMGRKASERDWRGKANAGKDWEEDDD